MIAGANLPLMSEQASWEYTHTHTRTEGHIFITAECPAFTPDWLNNSRRPLSTKWFMHRFLIKCQKARLWGCGSEYFYLSSRTNNSQLRMEASAETVHTFTQATMRSRKHWWRINDGVNTLGWMKCLRMVSDHNKNIEFSVFNPVGFFPGLFFLYFNIIDMM